MAPCVEWNVGFWTKVSGTQTPKNLNVITIVHYVIKVSIMCKAFVGKFYKKKCQENKIRGDNSVQS